MSGQYHQYCSAKDEWLIMKLCIYVRYHTANNVSNFGGDPVTQLNLINVIVCVSVCVSGDMSPYCSAYDEWLIMKICMYVRYHTANNVSNCAGDPVAQLHFIAIFNVMSPFCSAHDEWLIMKLCMYVRYHTVNNVSTFGGDPVTQLHFIKIFNVFSYLRHVKRLGICLPGGRSRSIINIH